MEEHSGLLIQTSREVAVFRMERCRPESDPSLLYEVRDTVGGPRPTVCTQSSLPTEPSRLTLKLLASIDKPAFLFLEFSKPMFFRLNQYRLGDKAGDVPPMARAIEEVRESDRRPGPLRGK
jgi:hypothetical protein